MENRDRRHLCYNDLEKKKRLNSKRGKQTTQVLCTNNIKQDNLKYGGRICKKGKRYVKKEKKRKRRKVTYLV